MRIRVFLLSITIALLYGGFLHNSIVFDDLYFFLKDAPEKYVEQGFQFRPRWWVYYSLGLTFVEIGPEIIWLRLGNLLLHIGVAIALFILIQRLLLDLDNRQQSNLNIQWVGFIAALLFALHPVAVYGAGYLIQRTILAATFFSLMTLLSLWLGMNGSRRWLWASVLFYGLAAFSKEHVVMVPATCAALWLLHRKSGLATDLATPPRPSEMWAVLLAQGSIAVLVTYLAIGGAHEILAPEMMQDMAERGSDIPQGLEYPLSVLTQAGLFFKYLGLWGVPDVTAMSVDMREPFALSLTPSRVAWLVAFCLYPVAAIWLLLQGRAKGLAGFALLTPWLLFATELVSVRLQEIFVLYRSYLWAPALFILLAMGLQRLQARMAIGIGLILSIFLAAFAFDRLTSFSHPYLLWDDAAKLAEKNVSTAGVNGIARIYHNRGLALYREGFVDKAIESYDQALAHKNDHSYVYNDRGAARLDIKDYAGALADFEQSIQLKSDYLLPYAGRAAALEKLGRSREASEAFMRACKLGWKPACEKRPTPQQTN